MAKTKHETHSIIVDFADVMWVPELNGARPTGNYGDKNINEALDRNLAISCWWKAPNGEVSADELTNKWEIKGKEVPLSELRDKEMDNRLKFWDYHKAAASNDPSKLIELDTFQQIFVHGGKLRMPKYIGVTGNRRAARFLAAMIRRRGMREDGPDGKPNTGKPLEMDYTLPISLSDFSDELDRLTLQVRENVGKTQGNLATSWVDMLLIGRRQLSLGATQSRLRDQFGASNGVKIYQMCYLDSKFPQVRILERANLPPTDPDWYPVQSVKYPILQGMAQRLTPEDTDEYNKGLVKKGEVPKPVLTLQEVQEYFADVKKNPEGDGGPKAADKNVMKQIEDFNKNPFAKIVANRIRTNTITEKFEKLEDFGACCEDLIVLAEQNDLPGAEKILNALVKTPKAKRTEVEKQLFKVLNIK